MRNFLSMLATILMTTQVVCGAEVPIIFISAFAEGENGAIHAFTFDSKGGALTPLHRTADIQNPFFLALSPDRHFLYAIHAEKFGDPGDELVRAYAIEGRSGSLRKLNEHSARGTGSCYLDVDATGRMVVVANYFSGSVAALPVGRDGSLGEVKTFMQHQGSSINPDRQKGPNAHSIVVSPDNRFALAADLGIDKIMNYRMDAKSAVLTANEAQPFVKLPPGSGPRHLTFHPNGKAVYVINELKNTVSFLGYEKDTGSLTERQTISTLPVEFTGTSHCADLKITPDGRFLFGTNRGHDSIAVYRIAEDGKLTLSSIRPSQGKGPQNLLITPDGQWLLCANMPGNNVMVFKIERESGEIQAAGQPLSMPMPSCIRWLR